MPWNSDLSKVYHLAMAWCEACKQAAPSSRHALRNRGHSGCKFPSRIPPTCWCWNLPAWFERLRFPVMQRQVLEAHCCLVLNGLISFSVLITADSIAALSALPALNRGALRPLVAEPGRKQAPQLAGVLDPRPQPHCLSPCNNQTARTEHLVLQAGPPLAADGQPPCQVVVLQWHELAILGLTRTHLLQNAPGKSVIHKGHYAFCWSLNNVAENPSN